VHCGETFNRPGVQELIKEPRVPEMLTMITNKQKGWFRVTLCACGLALLATGTGCQTTVGGQLLPSSYYISDDVQYFAPGPEFKLAREAATMKSFNAERELEEGP